MAIGDGWEEGAWVDEGWTVGAWLAGVVAAVAHYIWQFRRGRR